MLIRRGMTESLPFIQYLLRIGKLCCRVIVQNMSWRNEIKALQFNRNNLQMELSILYYIGQGHMRYNLSK